jgi:hypothetical protein
MLSGEPISFVEKMGKYMPGNYRNFIDGIVARPSMDPYEDPLS